MIQARKMTQKKKICDRVTYETRKGLIHTKSLSKASDKYNMIPRNILKMVLDRENEDTAK